MQEYLAWDARALGKELGEHPKFGKDEIWRFQIVLRKYEYYSNIQKNLIQKIYYFWLKYLYHRYSIKLGFSIPINVFDKGLSIAHHGSIVVNSNARVGKNCRIQENVTIGATGGNTEAPCIGNNVFIASGARIIGNVKIGDNIAIGANAVVVKSFPESNVTLGGVPAKVISHKGSAGFINPKAMEE
ncbi:serine O-acetyltransferase [Streptococcus alactolyticus]|uniref:serine O-acetyltransferase n=1 Tax=Streptococcus alactolyticus TaxID=29389 RepID=UPI003F9B044A